MSITPVKILDSPFEGDRSWWVVDGMLIGEKRLTEGLFRPSSLFLCDCRGREELR